jgi:hypothetical protein
MMKPLAIWTPFILISLLAFVFGETGYALSSYWIVLSVLGLIAAAFGYRAIWHSERRFLPVVIVLLGLFFGLWRLLGFLIVPLLWRWKGFAP